jgi:aminopeptidase
MTAKKHQEMLRKYAELVIKVGLNLRAGQRLIIDNSSTRGVPLHVAPFVREVARAAYAAGARYVDVIWNDVALLRMQAQLAPRDAFKEYSKWHIEGIMNIIDHGDALLTIRSNNPTLLTGLDPEFVGEMQKIHEQYTEPVLLAVTGNKINWCVISAAGPDWAAKVFPKLTPQKAEAKLWQTIFEINRLDQSNPLAAWKHHIQNLRKRSDYLTAKQYSQLRYTAPGTDLTLGLPRGHKWLSAREKAQNGIECIVNLPTEEVFTLPHREQAQGRISSTMPLIYGGSPIKDFNLTVENGRVVKVQAKKGEAILKKLVESDEGAARFGEAALVPQSSPITARKILFYDSLIDENASCHLAIGRAYQSCLQDASEITDQEFMQRGGNVSITHVDFMIGSNKLDIDGIRENGTDEPVMRRGEWAFDV